MYKTRVENFGNLNIRLRLKTTDDLRKCTRIRKG